MVAIAAPPSVGQLLRDWRMRRRMSQLELATEAGVSARHLSFVETGRSRPSREMVLHLAEYLDVPLRDRNPLLIAAGYAPSYASTDLAAPEMESVHVAIESLLTAHMPYPAILIDRHWNLVSANEAAMVLTTSVAPELLAPPINVMRTTLHPKGLAPNIVNLEQWADHLLGSLRRQVALTGDEELRALEDELAGYVREYGVVPETAREAPRSIALPMRLRIDGGELAFISMIATFGTALDVTLAELAIETFLPADAVTAAALHDASA